ncbi:MAG: hypothetical protein IT381_07305 [Deltaproteobacteria bacterium]|nr:hypothetical protein [Deltaproteobacteria bacterium]
MLHALALVLSLTADDGRVEVPLQKWEQMQQELAQRAELEKPPLPVAQLERRIDGTFKRGVFTGDLVARFRYFGGGGHARVPVIDGTAAVASVTLNGKRTSLLKEGDMYTVGLSEPGVYEVRARFLWGKEQDRFARRLRFRVPEAGTTAVSVLLPEPDIEARLAKGAIAAQTNAQGGTLLKTHLDAAGRFDLTWARKLTHKGQAKARLEARQYTVFSLQDAVTSGVSVFDVSVLEGETDRVDLLVPPGVEVLRVEGEAVLQWQSDPRAPELSVLLRYLLEGTTRIAVHFQYPSDAKGATLMLPTAKTATLTAGALGVAAAGGLAVSVRSAEQATALEAHDIPPELNELTNAPLALAYTHTAAPKIQLGLVRQEDVAVTSTVIDELQASTVLIESGREITKIKLRVRNNARQYLSVVLPSAAELTHSLVDGQAVRPAVSGANTLLFPLRQSEKLGAGKTKSHAVRDGETLSSIANLYYSDPTKTRFLLEHNTDVLADENDLQVGKVLRIPQKSGAVVEESSFVIELAYKQKSASMGWLGRREIALPKLDVAITDATWHVYLSPELEPLSFASNLVQYSAIRYDPLRRLRDFLRLGAKNAWAGGGYQSILKQRRGIWEAEVERKNAASDAVLTTFPLVGERYRFKRLLLKEEQPQLAVVYVAREIAAAIPWIVFLASAAVVLFVRRHRRWFARPVARAGAAGLALLTLFLAHYFLGVHRRVLWGVDLALLLSLLADARLGFLAKAAPYAASPWRLFELVSVRNWLLLVGLCCGVLVILSYPLLLSTFTLVALGFLSYRRARFLPAAAALLLLWAPDNLRAQDDDVQSDDAQFGEEPPEPAPEPAAEDAQPAGKNDAAFDQLMEQNENRRPVPRPSPQALVAPSEGKATVPLVEYMRVVRALEAARKKDTVNPGPAVVLGAADYSGEVKNGALALTMRLQATLGQPGRWKSVPLIGESVVLASAKDEHGQALPIVRQNGYHVWLTQAAAETSLTVELLVPARGPRGSIEYDFPVPRTPVTHVRTHFAQAGLEPRLDAAVQAKVERSGAGTTLDATLRPTTRLHLVGFREVADAGGQKAKVYAETLNLLSVDAGSLELFSVLRYTILYGGVKDFHVLVPKGFTVVSAEGEGAFRYVVEASDAGTLVRGETELPIRNAYEVSLRLRRELPRATDEALSIDAPLPRPQRVERDAGWLGIEVPGKLQLQEKAIAGVLPVDVRQLPPDMVESSVSPILKAYRYHAADAAVTLAATRLPEKDPKGASIDRLVASSLLSPEGTLLTDLSVTLRNRLRPSLVLALPEGATVVSALIDGQPVKPSRDAGGRLTLPLVRSGGDDRLRPFTVQLALEQNVGRLGWIGRPTLALPSVDLPISSLRWVVYVPERNVYSRLEGDLDGQVLAGEASWHQPSTHSEVLRAQATVAPLARAGLSAPATGGGGAMSVRPAVPHVGRPLAHRRFWIENDQPMTVHFWYLRNALTLPIGWLSALLVAVAVAVVSLVNDRRRRLAGATLAVLSCIPAYKLIGSDAVVLALLCGGLFAAARRGLLQRAWTSFIGEVRAMPQRFAARARPQRTKWQWLMHAAVTAAMAVTGCFFIILLLRVVWLLGRPL